MTARRWNAQDGTASVVQAALLMPLLALALGAVLHLGLYLLSRQVTVTAVQHGLTAATAADGSLDHGMAIATQLLTDHTAAQILDVSATDTPTTVTLTATVRTPAIVPAVTRTVTVTQTATKERWITP